MIYFCWEIRAEKNGISIIVEFCYGYNWMEQWTVNSELKQK